MLTYSFGLYCSCSDGRRVVHAYTTAATISGTVKSTDTYTYGNSAWKDQLTAYKGQTITYDAMGNPLSYRGKTMEWEQGRRLKKITGTNLTQTNSYDNDGIRTKKVVNGVTTEFYTSGSAILAQKSSDGTRLDFLYDDKGNLFAMEYAGERYFYQKNLQGDITGLIDSTGTEVVTYTYDTWGKLLSKTDGSGNGLAEKNPFRYRGYYYDAEVSLYYVSSRYYDPETRRFVNADDVKVLTVEPGEMTEKNLYAYCNNNPVNFQDKEGEFALAAEGVWLTANILVNVGVSFLAAQVVGQKFTLKDAAGIAVATIVSVVCKKALLGALAGAVIMGGSTFIFSMDNGASKKNALINGVTAAACSFISIGTCMDAANVGKTGFTLVEKALFGLENGLIYSSITEAMSRTNTNKKNKNKSKKQEKSKAKANTNVKKRRSRTQMLQDHSLQKMKSLGDYA